MNNAVAKELLEALLAKDNQVKMLVNNGTYA